MAESISELRIITKENRPEKRSSERSEERTSGQLPLNSDLHNDFHLDFREDQEGGYGDFGNPSFHKPLAHPFTPSLGISSARSGGYDRYGLDPYDPELDGYGGRPMDYNRRQANSNYYDRYYDEPLPIQTPTSEFDILSPRSRYDLACSPHHGVYGTQRDHREDYKSPYDYLSPRYRREPTHWGDRDSLLSYRDEPDSFNPSVDRMGYSSRYAADSDFYPSSYTYGMHMPRTSTPHANMSSLRSYDNRDIMFGDEGYDRRGYPLSDPSSPQPIYQGGMSGSNGHGHLGEINRGNRPYGGMQSFSRVHQSLSPAPTPGPAPVPILAPAPIPKNPSIPSGSTSTEQSVSSGTRGVAEEVNEAEDESYCIDATKIMQNLEERTVVLIRNIPNRYKLEDLKQVISTYVDEEYTILRLPIDSFTKRNLGYAFVNFSDSHEVLKLYLKVRFEMDCDM